MIPSTREVTSPEDYLLIRELFEEYQAEIGIDLCFQGFDQELDSLPQVYAPPKGILLLGSINRLPVGCVGLKPLEKGVVELKRLYVRPSHRGHNVGPSLVRRALREAQKARHHVVKLDTLASMKQALRLYEAMGFQQVAPYYDNPHADAIFMEKRIG